MRIGVVRTVGSPCRCGESVSAGLEALGHEPLLADSEEIELRASELAGHCDLVIDHTDTFRGRGFFRPLVRWILESRGAKVVGSDARACFLADDKAAAKERMAASGINVPPGIVADSAHWKIPRWLKPPFVLKPIFEHMSRGLALAGTEEEAYATAADLLTTLRQPLLVEAYIPGRELAVSLLAGPKGPEVLPVLEWRVDPGGAGILTESFKLTPVARGRGDAFRAELSPALREEIEELAVTAFEALGLRDYARFDLKLSPGGAFFFFEANTTPSLEPEEALALSARWAGLDYPGLVERMLSAGLGRYGEPAQKESPRIRIDLPCGPIELKVPAGVHHPPQSSIDLAKLLDVKPGENVLELGCGTGLLSIAAAKLGAGRVVATDLDPRALEATAFNARINGLEDRIEIRAGSWYEAVGSAACSGRRERFGLILATPPQTPGPRPFGPRYGGADGTRHLLAVVDGARDFLEPVGGRLWVLAISLADSLRLRRHLEKAFSAVTLVQETERRFTAEEYEEMEKGLFDYFLSLRSSGRSEFREAGKGQYVFRNLFFRASGPRRE